MQAPSCPQPVVASALLAAALGLLKALLKGDSGP
jgi:hypothetical protein